MKCESNENGRFLAQFGLTELSLKVKSKVSFFSERSTTFEHQSEKKIPVFYSRDSSIAKERKRVKWRKKKERQSEKRWLTVGSICKT